MVVFVALYLFYKIGMLGAGDVKLYAIASLFLSHQNFLWFLLSSMTIAVVIGVLRLVKQKNVRQRIYYFCSYTAEVIRLGKISLYLSDLSKTEQRKATVHMAGPMLAGCILCLFITI